MCACVGAHVHMKPCAGIRTHGHACTFSHKTYNKHTNMHACVHAYAGRRHFANISGTPAPQLPLFRGTTQTAPVPFGFVRLCPSFFGAGAACNRPPVSGHSLRSADHTAWHCCLPRHLNTPRKREKGTPIDKSNFQRFHQFAENNKKKLEIIQTHTVRENHPNSYQSLPIPPGMGVDTSRFQSHVKESYLIT